MPGRLMKSPPGCPMLLVIEQPQHGVTASHGDTQVGVISGDPGSCRLMDDLVMHPQSGYPSGYRKPAPRIPARRAKPSLLRRSRGSAPELAAQALADGAAVEQGGWLACHGRQPVALTSVFEPGGGTDRPRPSWRFHSQTPELGVQSASCACWDLCGERLVRGALTAIRAARVSLSPSPGPALKFLNPL